MIRLNRLGLFHIQQTFCFHNLLLRAVTTNLKTVIYSFCLETFIYKKQKYLKENYREVAGQLIERAREIHCACLKYTIPILIIMRLN